MYNYNQTKWKNNILENLLNGDEKITVRELLGHYLSSCSVIDQKFYADTADELAVENVLCNIVNETEVAKNNFDSNLVNTKIKRDSMAFGYDYLKIEDDHFYYNYLPYQLIANYIYLTQYDDEYIVLNLQDAWKKSGWDISSEDKKKYAYPNILIGMNNGSINHVISSIPPRDDEDEYNYVPESIVPEEVVNELITNIKNHSNEIENVVSKNREILNKRNVIEKRKELLEYANCKVIKLDNGMSLKFELNDETGPISQDNVKVNVLDENWKQVDTIKFNNLLDNIKESKFVPNDRNIIHDIKDRQNVSDSKNVLYLLNYKTNASAALPFIELENDIDLTEAKYKKQQENKESELQRRYEKSKQVIEEKRAREEELKTRFKEQQEDLIDTVQELQRQENGIPQREKMTVPKEVLCEWSDEKNCLVIRQEFKSNLKYFDLPYDLEDVDLTYTDLSESFIPNFQNIKDKNLEGCKLSGNKSLLNTMTNYSGFNFKYASLYSDDPIFLRGAKVNATTIKSLNKEYISNALEGSVVDQSVIDLINNSGEEFGIIDPIKVQDEQGNEIILKSKERTFVPIFDTIKPEVAEGPSLVSDNEAFRIVSQLVNERKLTSSDLEQLLNIAKYQEESMQNTNNNTHKM